MTLVWLSNAPQADRVPLHTILDDTINNFNPTFYNCNADNTYSAYTFISASGQIINLKKGLLSFTKQDELCHAFNWDFGGFIHVLRFCRCYSRSRAVHVALPNLFSLNHVAIDIHTNTTCNP